MKKVHKLFLLFLMTFVGIGNVLADNYEGKLFSVGALSTQLETGKWYFLFNNGTGKFAYENDAMAALKQGGSPEGISVSGNTGYMFQLVETDTEGKYFIQTGLQHFIPNPGSSVKPADEKGYGLKVTPIEGTEGHFNISGSIRKLTAPTTGGDLIGGNSAMEGSIGDWSFLEVIMEDESSLKNIAFIDSEVKRLCVANWDTNRDGELSEIEAAAVTTIDAVFQGNKSITSFKELQYFTRLTSIEQFAFTGCSGLTHITIPNSVTSIEQYAFWGCSGFSSIKIPNSVTSIEMHAFWECSGLTSIEIPNSVNSIGHNAFGGCTGLTSIIVESGNAEYDSRDNCNAIIETITNTLIKGCENTLIPNSVTSIGTLAFWKCSGLTSIEIPNSVTTIGNDAFYHCSSMQSVTIPNSVTSIRHSAFNHCSSLTSIEIPNSATSIEDLAFAGCTNLTSVTVSWNTPIIINSWVFSEIDLSKVTLHVPVGTKSLYQQSDVWKDFGKIVEKEIFATSVSLNQASANIKPGESITLTATIFPSNTTNKSVTWKSSDTKIATVDNNGVVTAIKIGTATITATTTDGTNLSATCKVTVDPVLATSITLNRTSASVKIGETLKLTCTLKPDNVTSKDVQWSSSDTKIATVDNNGVVTAVKVGTATITVTTTDGSNLSSTCKVTVDPILATSISINSSSLDLKVGHSATLSATVLPENATNKNKEWSSSNPNIATVSEGIVTAVSPGTCVIKVKTVDGSNLTATCTVAVADIPVSTLSIDKTSIDLLVEEETLITASVYPADATNKALVWSSSNGSVASVSNGKVKALNAGSAIISVRTTDGSNKMETCNVTVKKHSQTIEWNQDLSYITYGGELIGLKATASSGLPVVFSSSNDNVASIIDMGSIVYLNPGNPGSSKITATQGGNYYYESVSVVKDANVIDPSGVENVTDSSEKYTIYDIAGLRIGTYTQQEYDELISNKLIPAGIYIVNGLKKFIGK